ncbi:NRDE family protein [Ferrimonas balearica]|uniref:NRDE family protein n=1 Tax=Ferrimonas balearica TaxID=44012 RepID=UPI001C990310|nr:NRDE family protein [Ferrimonas balearica]MBY5992486.1 NRDE family protein [Ferrimonas balearica]
MCIIALEWRPGSDCPLTLLANRDEFYARPAEGVQWWPQGFWAGKDLEAGGSWLGLSQDGALAAVTNVRDPAAPRGARSRGELVTDFLAGGMAVEAYQEGIRSRRDAYGPFNLLLARGDRLCYYANLEDEVQTLAPGRYGLSNARLNTPWPKVVRLTDALARGVDGPLASLAEALADPWQPADAALPDTGIGWEWERALAPIFIQSDHYGTRSSTALRLDRAGRFLWLEREYGPEGARRDAAHRGQLTQPLGR